MFLMPHPGRRREHAELPVPVEHPGVGYTVGWDHGGCPRLAVTGGLGPALAPGGTLGAVPGPEAAACPRRLPDPGADVGEGEDHAWPAGLAVAQEGGRAAVLPLLQAPHHLHPRLRGEAAPHQGERPGIPAHGEGQRVAQLWPQLALGSRDRLSLPWRSPRGAGLAACGHLDLLHVVLAGVESRER